MLPISEIFYSIQGEGTLIGLPSIFIRVFGCNLRCTWCDTKYAVVHQDNHSPQQFYSLDEIIEKISIFPSRHVVITGGEPTIFSEVALLTQHIRKLDKHITVETNGTQYNSEIQVDLISISPKLQNSLNNSSICVQNIPTIQSWLHHVKYCPTRYQLKFSVQEPDDIYEIQNILQQLSPTVPNENVVIMPIGTSVAEISQKSNVLIPLCLQNGYRFSTRLHIYLFGGKRGC